jgi:hypothetical protein
VAEQDASSTAPRDAAQSNVHCMPGEYAGTFTGSVEVIGVSLSSVSGVVRAVLTLDASRQRLQMESGLVAGVDQSGNSVAVDLSGSINCATNQVEGGRLDNGVIHIRSSDTDISFIGTVQAAYSADPYSLVGTWTIEAPGTASLLTGQGTWSLALRE